MPFDPTWLTAPVDRRAVRAFAADLRRRGVRSPRVVQAVVLSVLLGLMAFAFETSVAIGLGIRIENPAVALLAWLAMTGLVIWACIAIPRAALARGNEKSYRLSAFAAANGMALEPQALDPRLPGLIFNQGRGRSASDRVRGTQPRFVEFGNYQYTTGSGEHNQTHRWGYVAIHLDTPLPNIVLDARGNNSVFGSNLPTRFDRSQKLSLEGNFDEYFSLYCPQGYEVDALYLFTPDIMARFVDHASILDIEIVDDWMFLYSPLAFSTLDPKMWGWLFGVVGALTEKLQRWERWRDERLALPADRPRALPQSGNPLPFVWQAAPAGAAVAAGQPHPAQPAAAAPHPAPPAPPAAGFLAGRPRGVAEPGRRLEKKFPWWGFVILAVVIVLGIFGALIGGVVAAVGG